MNKIREEDEYHEKIIVCMLLCAMFGTMLTGCFHSHTPGEWKIVRKATATNNGLMQKECTECGEIVEEKEYKRTKEEAIEEAQLEALEGAKRELKAQLKNPSSLVINNAHFYFGEYDAGTKTMRYAALKLDYNATNSFGGSTRDTYVYFMKDMTELTTEQFIYIMQN